LRGDETLMNTLHTSLAARLLTQTPLGAPADRVPDGPGLYTVTADRVTRVAAVDPLWPAHPDPIEVCHAVRLSVEAAGWPVAGPVEAVALYVTDTADPSARSLFAATPDGHAHLLRRIGDQPPVDETADPSAIGVIHHPLAMLARAFSTAPPLAVTLPDTADAEAAYARLLDTVALTPPPLGTPTQAWRRVQTATLRLHAMAVVEAATRTVVENATATPQAVGDLIRDAVLERRLHLGDAQPMLAELGLPLMRAAYEVRLHASVIVEVTASDADAAADEAKSRLDDRLSGDHMWLDPETIDVAHVSDPDPCE
jgi:hypothetical protein